jgi:pimeloyl-ACP methyl ester carboxylesterase
MEREHPLDLNRIVLVGHSSGGHFAAWPMVDFRGVVMADAFIDPLVIDSRGVDGSLYCNDRCSNGSSAGGPKRARSNFAKADTAAFAAVRRAVLRLLAK